jgi:hypothetical protein
MLPTVYWVRGLERGRLAVVARPDPAYGLPQQMQLLREIGVDVLVSMLQSEEAIRVGLAWEANVAQEAGLAFHNLATDDFGVPATFEGASAVIAAAAASVCIASLAGDALHSSPPAFSCISALSQPLPSRQSPKPAVAVLPRRKASANGSSLTRHGAAVRLVWLDRCHRVSITFIRSKANFSSHRDGFSGLIRFDHIRGGPLSRTLNSS